MEIDACLFPPSPHCTFRQVVHGSDFGERKPAEEFQVNQPGELRLDIRQSIQGIADRRELFRVSRILCIIGSERRDFELATSFDRATVPRMIDDESAHYPGGIPHKALGPERRVRRVRICRDRLRAEAW